MYKGEGQPGFYRGNSLTTLPHPVKEKDDDYKRLTKHYENIYGEITSGRSKWRYDNEYVFSKLDQLLVDDLIEADNNGQPVMWVPHLDFPIIKYQALLSVTLKGTRGLVYMDTAIVRVKGTKILWKKPSIDNMITAVRPTQIIFIKEE